MKDWAVTLVWMVGMTWGLVLSSYKVPLTLNIAISAVMGFGCGRISEWLQEGK